ncbi:hypothetical protein CRG98_028100 [Punica granatum]|uniref:Uncharacterized protein n=1 Tax=Punica granatum TaxID=22663 RepID=A0A2I0J6K6_PUNGR|nr:hypothetical protein CRG98_028100 [Punica granatum]
MAKFCFFALIALLSVYLASSADPPQISPSPAPKLAADSTPTISPSKPTASLTPAPANAPHGSISSLSSLPPSDAAPASSPSTSPSPPSQSPFSNFSKSPTVRPFCSHFFLFCYCLLCASASAQCPSFDRRHRLATMGENGWFLRMIESYDSRFYDHRPILGRIAIMKTLVPILALSVCRKRHDRKVRLNPKHGIPKLEVEAALKPKQEPPPLLLLKLLLEP